MSLKIDFATVIGTVGCAAAIGFIMQSGELAEMRYGSGSVSATAVPIVGHPVSAVRVRDMTVAGNGNLLEVEQITLTSAVVKNHEMVHPSEPSAVSIAIGSEMDEQHFDHDIALSPECEMSALSIPTSAAMVDLLLTAPCYAGERVVVTQRQLQFTEVLDEKGILQLTLPALKENTRISIDFKNGDRISTFATVDSTSSYDRVILQWTGPSELQIHAREFGAEYGTEGHVWAGAPRDHSVTSTGRKGFLTNLGKGPSDGIMRAEVYTFPADAQGIGEALVLTIETAVTEFNCGTEIHATTFEFLGGRQVASQNMRLDVPHCDAIGDVLVLNNLLRDLTVASK